MNPSGKLTSRKSVIASIRRLHRTGQPLNLAAVIRSHPDLLRAVYGRTPFWGWRQALADAGIQYNAIRVVLRDTVTCRLCGFEGAALIGHITRHHDVSPADYLDEYPQAELCSETYRASLLGRFAGRKSRRILPHWEPLWSAWYVLDRVWAIHQAGKPVHHIAILDKEPSLVRQADRYFGGWDAVLIRLGLDPFNIRLSIPHGRWTRQIVRDELKRLAGMRKQMMRQDLEAAGHRPLCQAAKRLFGAYEAALVAAGIDPGKVMYRTPPVYTDRDRATLVRAIRQVAGIRDEERRDQAVRGVRERFDGVVAKYWGAGCWAQAAREAQVDPALVQRLKGRYPTKKHVTREIEHRCRAGQPLTVTALARKASDFQLLRKARLFFGSWDAALESAGLEANRIRVRKRSPYRTAEMIIQAIRERRRLGLPLNPAGVRFGRGADKPLHDAGCNRFGGWRQAVQAAGIDYDAELPRKAPVRRPLGKLRAVGL